MNIRNKIEKITGYTILELGGEDDRERLTNVVVLLVGKLNEIIDKLNELEER